jgi:hypothetical protein
MSEANSNKGRKKGTKNKRTLFKKNTEEILKKEGVHPILALARFVKDQDPATGDPYQEAVFIKNKDEEDGGHWEMTPGFSQEIRLTAARDLAQYVAPKRKAVEHSGPGGVPLPSAPPPVLNINFIDVSKKA